MTEFQIKELLCVAAGVVGVLPSQQGPGQLAFLSRGAFSMEGFIASVSAESHYNMKQYS